MFKGRVLVTGGTGLVGRKVVDLLAQSGTDVTTVSLEGSNASSKTRHYTRDLRDFKSCLELTSGMEVVLHLAGIKSNPKQTAERPASFFAPLLQVNTNVLEACRINMVPKVVFTSSIGAYPNIDILNELYANDDVPMDGAPGKAKRIAEELIYAYKKEYGLNYRIARLGTVYGEGDNFNPDTAMVIPSLIAKIHRGDNPVQIWGDGTAIRDFTYSSDIAKGIIHLAEYDGCEQLFNLASGVGVSIKKLVQTLQSFINFDYEFDTTQPSGQSIRIMAIDKARRMLGYQPEVSLEDGLLRTWTWYLEHNKEGAYDPFK
jgi:GDP-L-fucose synthase